MSGTWASGWALNDIVTVSEFAKGVGGVADSTLGASAASIDFLGLPTTYAHLRIVLYARGDTAAAQTGVAIRFNNDSAANYFSAGASFTDAAASFAGQVAAATSATCGNMPASTAAASYFGALFIDIPNYGNTVGNKVFSATGYILSNSGTGNQFAISRGGAWASTTAISRVTLLPAAGNFVTSTRASIYVWGA